MGTRVQELLDRFAVPGANAATLLCDRHLAGDIALTAIDADMSEINISYGELLEKSTQFAAALTSVGVNRGDYVATLMGTSVELAISLLGIWRLGAVAVPLTPAFTHADIAARLQGSAARLVICDAAQRRKLVPPGEIPTDASLPVVVARGDAYGYDHSFTELLAAHADTAVTAGEYDGGSLTLGDDDALALLFRSREAALLEPVPITLSALASLAAHHCLTLEVRHDDVFCALVDPGCAHEIFFALLAPLAAGHHSLLIPASYSAELLAAAVEKGSVTHLAASPAAWAMLQAGAEKPAALRQISRIGGTTAPEIGAWGSANVPVNICSCGLPQ